MALRAFILAAALLASFSTAQAQDRTLRKAPVDGDGRFFNPWRGEEGKSFFDFLKWKFSKNPYEEQKKAAVDFPVRRPDFKALEALPGDWFVWLGHSTVLMRVAGKVVLTDPIFWDVNFLVRRKTPFPVDPGELPKIDFVLISHGHYDHLDTRTVKYLKDRFDPLFLTGPGYEDYFSSIGITRHAPVDWSETHASNGLRITALPVQHWSKRGLFDGNRMLWCSYLVEGGGRKYYWVGDSGYFAGFREIGDRYGPVDVFFAPVGAFEPRWFMLDNHMSPEEAVQAARDLRARVLVPIHWGTFDLSDEPLGLPVRRLREAYVGAPGFTLKVLEHGGSYAP